MAGTLGLTGSFVWLSTLDTSSHYVPAVFGPLLLNVPGATPRRTAASCGYGGPLNCTRKAIPAELAQRIPEHGRRQVPASLTEQSGERGHAVRRWRRHGRV